MRTDRRFWQKNLLLTCLVLLFPSILLAACRGQASPAVPPAAPATPVASPTGTPEAPTLTPLLPTATFTSTSLPPLNKTIQWCLQGAQPADLAQVEARLNQLLSERGFNAQVEILVEEQIVYPARLAERQQSDRPCDLFYLPAGHYENYLERGLLLPLHAEAGPTGGQIDHQASKLWSSRPEVAWEGLRRSGSVYAVPNQGPWALPSGVLIRADIVEALNLLPVLAGLSSYPDLTPVLEKIHLAINDGTLEGLKAVDGERVDRVFGQTSLLEPYSAGYDVLSMPFVVHVDNPQGQVINWFSTAAFVERANLRREWQKAGFGPAVPLTPDEVVEGYRSGRYTVEIGRSTWPGSPAEQAGRFGYQWVNVALGPAFLTTAGVQSSLTGLYSGLAGQPERLQRVYMLLDWLHSEPDLVNLLAYGIEDVHWRWLDPKQQVISLVRGSRYLPDYLNQLGDNTLRYFVDQDPPGLAQAVHQANAQAQASPALGFVFDPRLVAGEAAVLQAVLREWLDPLEHGQVENIESYLERMAGELENAGLLVVQAEVERQFQAWLADRP